MTEQKLIAVDGATGNQFGDDLHSSQAEQLAAAGASIVEADLNDEVSVRTAFEGVHRTYAVTTHFSRREFARTGRVFRLAIAALLAAAALMTPACLPTDWSVLAGASADPCPDVEVVFARGTGEPPGVGRVGQAFAASLSHQLNGKSMAVYPVDYPASRDFLRATEGANDASTFLEQFTASCPKTKMVLGGYSQGAAVIDIITVASQPVLGFTEPLPADLADRIAAVAVFGNPSNRVGGPLEAVSPMYGYKTIDLCNGGDPVCSGGNDVSAHSLYVESGIPSRAADFVASQIEFPPTASPS